MCGGVARVRCQSSMCSAVDTRINMADSTKIHAHEQQCSVITLCRSGLRIRLAPQRTPSTITDVEAAFKNHQPWACDTPALSGLDYRNTGE